MNKFSVVIPYRDRQDHISVLAPHLKKFARANNLDMEIIVVEQNDDDTLRRGALRNEGVRVSTGNIIALHDVDYLPDMNTPYWVDGCDVFRPVHRVEFVTMEGALRPEEDVPSGYRTFKDGIDDNFYGGVLCITKDAFLEINGYNPMYRGWGLEDDDFRERIRDKGLRVKSGAGTFYALPHPDSFRNDELFHKNQLLFHDRHKYQSIGINCGTLQTHHNHEKAKRYGVDVWLEVTNWAIPNLNINVTSLSNIANLDYGKFAVLDNVMQDHVQTTVARGERWEPEVMALCEKYVRPNTTAVDIGSNMGTFTVRLAQLVGPNGKVISFEPQRIMFQQTCCNVFLNKLTNVHSYQLALGNYEHKKVHLTPINYTDGAPGEVRIHGNEGEEVDCVSLDMFDLDNVSLIKMDVERYEPFVFDGARKTIQKNRPVILFELTTLPLPDYPNDFVIHLLAEMNYNVYEISEWGDYLAIPVESDDNV